MSVQLPPSLHRLARSNPAPLEPRRVEDPAAQALLQQILATPRVAPRRRRFARSPRLIAVAVTAGLVATGGAVAATDPFGFWRSNTLGAAMYGIDSSKHIRALTVQQIRCQPVSLRCGVHVHGQLYALDETVSAPPALTRRFMTAAIAKAQVSPALKHQFRADLAAVSDSFLARLSLAMHFGTYGGGSEIPPPGVPEWIVCQRVAAGIVCQNLNGDEHVPIGAGIYGAVPGPGWRSVEQSGPQPPQPATARMFRSIFGGPLTPAEFRLLRDLVTTSGTSSSSSVRARPVRRSARRAAAQK